MKIIVLTLTLIASLLIIPAQSYAQHARSTTKQHHFSVYPIGTANWNNIYFQPHPDQFQGLEFRAYERSKIYSYKGEFPLKFFRKTQLPNGKETYQAIAQVFPHSNSNHYLCFFTPIHKDSNWKFKVVALNDDSTAFPIDTITFLNATGVRLKGHMGEETILLTKGISKPFPIQLDPDSPTPIELAITVGTQTRTVLKNQWYFNNEYRELVVLLPPKDLNSYRIQAFRISQHKDVIFSDKSTLQPEQDEQ